MFAQRSKIEQRLLSEIDIIIDLRILLKQSFLSLPRSERIPFVDRFFFTRTFTRHAKVGMRYSVYEVYIRNLRTFSVAHNTYPILRHFNFENSAELKTDRSEPCPAGRYKSRFIYFSFADTKRFGRL